MACFIPPQPVEDVALPGDLDGVTDSRVRDLYDACVRAYPAASHVAQVYLNDAITTIGEHKPTLDQFLQNKGRCRCVRHALPATPEFEQARDLLLGAWE
jgi:hypothetical protein